MSYKGMSYILNVLSVQPVVRMCSLKLSKMQRKTPVTESFFSKVTGVGFMAGVFLSEAVTQRCF